MKEVIGQSSIEDVPRGKTGKILWARLRREPDVLREILESEARRIDSVGIKLTQQELLETGNTSFYNAVKKYYPGGFIGLKDTLNVDRQKKKGYWNLESIELEAKEYIDNGQTLTINNLVSNGRADLKVAIHRHYPGGIRALRLKISGRDLDMRPKGYWTPEEIKASAQVAYEAEGKLTYQALNNSGRSGLGAAINKYYLGKIRKLREDLGIEAGQRSKGYWSPQMIEEQAAKFVAEHGSITRNMLEVHGRLDLDGAIKKHYPGGIRALREKIGLADPSLISIFEAYQHALENGEQISFEDFLGREK